MHTDRQAGRQADRQTDRQTDRQAGRHTGRQTNIHRGTNFKICTNAYLSRKILIVGMTFNFLFCENHTINLCMMFVMIAGQLGTMLAVNITLQLQSVCKQFLFDAAKCFSDLRHRPAETSYLYLWVIYMEPRHGILLSLQLSMFQWIPLTSGMRKCLFVP